MTLDILISKHGYNKVLKEFVDVLNESDYQEQADILDIARYKIKVIDKRILEDIEELEDEMKELDYIVAECRG